MAETVRISPGAHAILAELAESLHIPQTEVLAIALEEYRKTLFFQQLHASHAARTAKEQAEDEEETAAWDATLMDGLEAE